MGSKKTTKTENQLNIEPITKTEEDKELCKLYYRYKKELEHFETATKHNRFHITYDAFNSVKNNDIDLFNKTVEYFTSFKENGGNDVRAAAENFNVYFKENYDKLAFCKEWTEINGGAIQRQIDIFSNFSTIF